MNRARALDLLGRCLAMTVLLEVAHIVWVRR